MEVVHMINDESKRKLRELNMSELIDALEIQQLEPATLKLKFDDRISIICIRRNATTVFSE